MDIGVPKELRDMEFRVAVTPAIAQALVEHGHHVYVEHDAGKGSGFTDLEYEKAGARIVFSTEEAYLRADLLVKVARPTPQEFEWMREGQTVMAFFHLASARVDKILHLLRREVTAVGLELIQRDDGCSPTLRPMSELAGGMLPYVASRFLQNDHGGKGIFLGGVAGVPPAQVVIIGAGTVGCCAAKAFERAGATVHVLDNDIRKLRNAIDMLDGRVITMLAHPANIRKAVSFADVVVTAAREPGKRAPIIVTREMVKSMRRRSLIIDVAVDEGGNVETSRPTSHRNPVFMEEGVMHYCVPNITSVVARTATHALSNALFPFLLEIADEGIDAALEKDTALARGVYTRGGHIVNKDLAAQRGKELQL